MFTASNIAYYATWLSAWAFLISSIGYTIEMKWIPMTLYLGLFLANGSIAILATRA